MTAPPANAIWSAWFKPERAASIVLTLVFVATLMPAQPAPAESAAPDQEAKHRLPATLLQGGSGAVRQHHRGVHRRRRLGFPRYRR